MPLVQLATCQRATHIHYSDDNSSQNDWQETNIPARPDDWWELSQSLSVVRLMGFPTYKKRARLSKHV